MVLVPAWYSSIHSILLAIATQISALFHHVAHWVLRSQKRGLKWTLALGGIAAYAVGMAYLMVQAGWFSAVLLILTAPGMVFLGYLLWSTSSSRGTRNQPGSRTENLDRHSPEV